VGNFTIFRKPFGKQLLGRRKRWEDNIKTVLGEIFSEGGRWMEMVKIVSNVELLAMLTF
jgi:hypothetical protein